MADWAVRDAPADVHVLFPNRFLWSAGGKFERVVQSWSFLTGLEVLVNIPLDREGAVSPYILLHNYSALVKHSEMSWDLFLTGAGIRYSPHFETDGGLYVSADVSYLRGDGRDDDRIRHPGFDTTLFEPDRGGQMKPRNLYGYSLGAALGLEVFGTSPIGVGLEVGGRYQDGTRGITAFWVHAGWTFSIRF